MLEQEDKERTRSGIDDYILRVTEAEKPKTVRELVILVKERLGLPEKQIIDQILGLQDSGRLSLEDGNTSLDKHYLSSSRAIWYWATMAMGFATVASVFAIPENDYPFVLVRYLLGSIFIMFLPGYSVLRSLFPERMRVSGQGRPREVERAERIVLAIVTSMALVPMVGLLLNYTPFGLSTSSITMSLLTLTLTFATTGAVLEQRRETKGRSDTMASSY